MRASSGTLSWSRRYSFSDSSVSIDIAKRSGAISRGSKSRRARPRRSRRGCPWRRPRRRACACRAATRAAPSAAAMVVLPTPPLPVTNSSCRSSRSVGIGSHARSLGSSEADATGVRGACRARRRRACRAGCRPGGPCRSVSQNMPPPFGDGLLERSPSSTRGRCRRPARPRSPWVVGHTDADVHSCSSGRGGIAWRIDGSSPTASRGGQIELELGMEAAGGRELDVDALGDVARRRGPLRCRGRRRRSARRRRRPRAAPGRAAPGRAAAPRAARRGAAPPPSPNSS